MPVTARTRSEHSQSQAVLEAAWLCHMMKGGIPMSYLPEPNIPEHLRPRCQRGATCYVRCRGCEDGFRFGHPWFRYEGQWRR